MSQGVNAQLIWSAISAWNMNRNAQTPGSLIWQVDSNFNIDIFQPQPLEERGHITKTRIKGRVIKNA